MYSITHKHGCVSPHYNVTFQWPIQFHSQLIGLLRFVELSGTQYIYFLSSFHLLASFSKISLIIPWYAVQLLYCMDNIGIYQTHHTVLTSGDIVILMFGVVGLSGDS